MDTEVAEHIFLFIDGKKLVK